MKTFKIKTFSIICTFGIIFPGSFVLAREEIGFFFNENLQEILESEYSLEIDGKKIPLDLVQFVAWQNVLVPNSNHQSEIENIHFCNESVSNLSVCDLTDSSSQKTRVKKGALLFVHEDKIEEYLKTVSEDITRESQNAKFHMNDNDQLVVTKKSKPGYALNISSSKDQVMNAIKTNSSVETIPLIVNYVEPEISEEKIDELGIKEKIGHGESNFVGSPSNRKFNIKVATEKFDGVVLKPSEEFSFVELLGPVDGESGYKEELVIKNNETIPEFGGGICQVSTTMFRAALNSGFKITERRNHAYPVQYYSPQGTDATIYIPKPDLMFINNSPAHVLIQSTIVGSRLHFDIFGTSDGRQVELEGPRVTQRTEDGKMRTILHQVVKNEEGEEIRRATFKSFYDNPDNYHHEPRLTEKPKDWSKSQWKDYRREHGL